MTRLGPMRDPSEARSVLDDRSPWGPPQASKTNARATSARPPPLWFVIRFSAKTSMLVAVVMVMVMVVRVTVVMVMIVAMVLRLDAVYQARLPFAGRREHQ